MKKNELSAIGTIETISFPTFGIDNVLAKIDTGADSSAIWASNIHEVNGTLSFMLFGPSSTLYSGKEIKTRKYSLVTVKNSFGQKEIRYKVELPIKIADRQINSRITLANRMNNRFPVLIGRRTLRGKFLVDVSKKNNLIQNQSIAVLAESNTAYTQTFMNNAQDDGMDVKLLFYKDLTFYINSVKSTIDVLDRSDDLMKYSLVYFLDATLDGSFLATIAYYLDSNKVDYFDRSSGHYHGLSRLYVYYKLALNHIDVPESYFASHNSEVNYAKIESLLGLPFVLADSHDLSYTARAYLIKDKLTYDRTIKQAKSLDLTLIAHKQLIYEEDFIVFVLGGQAVLAVKRLLTKDYSSESLITVTVSKVIKIDINEIPSSVINNIIAATKLCYFQMAEVNITQDKKTNIWYCLGVINSLQDDQSEFMVEKQSAIIKYLSQRLNN